MAEKQNRNADEIVPLLKDQTPFKPPSKASTMSLKHSCTESTIDTSKTPGKMRHDIPHRWKRQFVIINSNRCQVCMERLPYFRHVYRCRDCEMTVHQHCRQSVVTLQYATNRRIFLQRRPSSAIINNMLLMALESPQNLSINSTQMLGSEWLLIGAQEGLFATSLQQQQLRAPFQIAGIPKIFWMELLSEFDMLLTICGTNRSLMCIHIQQLNRAFKAEQQPIANLRSVSNIEQCHIAELSKPEYNREKRFVYIATIDSIVILQYISKLGVFSPIKKFKTEEPCMCICSTPVGFIYGADNFHFINFENDFSTYSQLMVENCPFDFPVSVVAISDNEYLLAFHNFGLFVDSQGKRTRAKNVEWEKVPMEFVYTAPFLYIVYCEFLEVVRIAPLVGIDSGTLTDDRNMFKCRLAHYTGHGLNPQEVFFAVSSEDRVELHSFSHYAGEQQTPAVKSILKRKMHENGALQSSETKKKY